MIFLGYYSGFRLFHFASRRTYFPSRIRGFETDECKSTCSSDRAGDSRQLLSGSEQHLYSSLLLSSVIIVWINPPIMPQSYYPLSLPAWLRMLHPLPILSHTVVGNAGGKLGREPQLDRLKDCASRPWLWEEEWQPVPIFCEIFIDLCWPTVSSLSYMLAHSVIVSGLGYVWSYPQLVSCTDAGSRLQIGWLLHNGFIAHFFNQNGGGNPRHNNIIRRLVL